MKKSTASAAPTHARSGQTQARQFSLALLAACCVAAPALAVPPAPPISDGSAGSFSALAADTNFPSKRLNTDTGQLQVCNSAYCFISATVVFTTVKYNGQMLHVFNFTDFNLASNLTLAIYGNAPALILANQDITIAGPVYAYNAGGAAGASAPQTSTAIGGMGGLKTGGQGGQGQAGEIVFCNCCTTVFTAGGGGGGGNISNGQSGLPGVYPQTGQLPVIIDPAGPGGIKAGAAYLRGGGGGAGGGGGNAFGNFYTTLGGRGGGAIVVATSGSLTIASTGILSAAAQPGQLQGYTSGSGGGGGGGDLWIFASGTVTNSGSITAAGGAGGANTITYDGCVTPGSEAGPNGGNGSGGFVAITATTITNMATIDVSQGAGGTTNGGKVELNGHVAKRGTILGRFGAAK